MASYLLLPKIFVKEEKRDEIEEEKEKGARIETQGAHLHFTPLIKTEFRNYNSQTDDIDIYAGLSPPSQLSNKTSNIISPINNNNEEEEEEEGEYCEVCGVRYEERKEGSHKKSALHMLRLAEYFTKEDEREKVVKRDEYLLPTGNKGYQLLLKQGWEGKGLGKGEDGIKHPIKTSIKNDRLGLGNKFRCPARITHYNSSSLPERPKLQHRILPFPSISSPVYSNIFSALDLLRPLEEESHGHQSKKLRALQLQRNQLKSSLLRRELYSDL